MFPVPVPDTLLFSLRKKIGIILLGGKQRYEQNGRKRVRGGEASIEI